MLNRLVYFSERLAACDDAALEKIVADAAQRNRARDITGLLIADERAFIQILEGPRTAVSLLFQDISRDARHRNVVLVEFTEIHSLSYPRWGMASASDKQKLDAAWARVTRDQIWEPLKLNALQLRGLLKIALGDARPVQAVA